MDAVYPESAPECAVVDVGEALFWFGVMQAVAIIVLALFEGLQVYSINKTAKYISKRFDEILPPGTKAGDIFSQGVLSFMKRLNDSPEDAAAVGSFVRGSALAAWSEVSAHVPLLKGGAESSEAMEKLKKKYPLLGLAEAVASVVLPAVQQKVSETATQQRPTSGRGPRF